MSEETLKTIIMIRKRREDKQAIEVRKQKEAQAQQASITKRAQMDREEAEVSESMAQQKTRDTLLSGALTIDGLRNRQQWKTHLSGKTQAAADVATQQEQALEAARAKTEVAHKEMIKLTQSRVVIEDLAQEVNLENQALVSAKEEEEMDEIALSKYAKSKRS